MNAARNFCHGLRIIRQPKWECLATFICSSMKQVAHIRQISLALRKRFGEQRRIGDQLVYTFALPRRVAQTSEKELRDATHGYRFAIAAGRSSSDCGIRLVAPRESVPERKDPGTPGDFKHARKISPNPYTYVLRLPFGALFLSTQVGLIVAWAFLYGIDRRNNGTFCPTAWWESNADAF